MTSDRSENEAVDIRDHKLQISNKVIQVYYDILESLYGFYLDCLS